MLVPTGLPTRRKFLERSVLGAGSLLFAPLLLDSCTDHVIPPPGPPTTPPLLGDVAIDWNDKAKVLVKFGVEGIPEVGDILGPLVDLFWPKTQEDVWGQVRAQTEALVSQKIADNVYQTVSDDLAGLNNNIIAYQNELKNGAPSDIKTQWMITKNLFINKLPNFQSAGYQVPLMGLFVQFTNLYLALLRDGVVAGTSWGRTPADHQQDIGDLTQAIIDCSNYVTNTYEFGPENDLITHTPVNNHLCEPFRSLNTLERTWTLMAFDFRTAWKYYDVTFYPNGAVDSTGKKINILTREIYSDPYGTCDDSGPIVIATPVPTQLPTNLTVWGSGLFNAAKVTYPAGSGPGGVTQTEYMGGGNGWPFSFNLSPDNPITQYRISYGSVIGWIQFMFHDGTTTNVIGGGGNSGEGNYQGFPNEALSSVHINGISSFYNSADCIVLGFEHWVPPSATLNALQDIYVKSPKERSVADFVKSFPNLAIPANLITDELKAARKAHWEYVKARA